MAQTIRRSAYRHTVDGEWFNKLNSRNRLLRVKFHDGLIMNWIIHVNCTAVYDSYRLKKLIIMSLPLFNNSHRYANIT